MISFGPVPSRRLGKSLGINNISSGKVCSYSCVYCQVGITHKFSNQRQKFYDPEVICSEVKKQLAKLSVADQPDYLTFVANGEPTLDINLGRSIEKLKLFNIPVAVITNASLLIDPQVRADLLPADWVSVKIDAGNEDVWKKLNRPADKIDFEMYVKGLITFSNVYKGKLVSETMLVKGLNDTPEELNQVVTVLKSVQPSIAYISVPTRPPAVKSVLPPDEKDINLAYQLFSENQLNAELIIGFEGTDTGFTGNAIEDILNICFVHPIRQDTMNELLKKDQVNPGILTKLLDDNYIKRTEYKSNVFYIRKFPN
ncbi:MAG: radical SAM protein [Bacteroidia bacterium]|nr:radical SAM protein [Bacteroidia bacterium]